MRNYNMDNSTPQGVPSSSAKSSLATLYYDGACPLCSREMNTLRRCTSNALSLVDIHDLTSLNHVDVDKHTLLQTLHMQTADGEWVTGISANVLAWQYTKYGVFFRWLEWPLIKSVARFIYSYWTRVRYQKNLKSGMYK